MMTLAKVSCLILDAGPLITNGYSTLSGLADEFFTTPSVYNEIRDEQARQSLLLWGDKLGIRQPSLENIRLVSEFAKKTGDYSVLSAADLQVLALTYELECEKNNGDWRLRKVPGQSRINGPRPSATDHKPDDENQIEELVQKMHGTSIESEKAVEDKPCDSSAVAYTEPNDPSQTLDEPGSTISDDNSLTPNDDDGWSTIARKARTGKKYNKGRKQQPFPKNISHTPQVLPVIKDKGVAESHPETVAQASKGSEQIDWQVPEAALNDSVTPDDSVSVAQVDERSSGEVQPMVNDEDEDEDDEVGWITPENLQHQQILDGIFDSPNDSKATSQQAKKLKVGMASGDFAMQNVAMQIGINVINPQSGRQIRKIRSWMLRCHACFFLTPPSTGDKPKQFCPRCGGATLLRCTVTTSAATGQLQIHLKKNFQWSHRGNRYSLPNPQSKKNRKNGGEGMEEILLREDQKEYLKAVKNDAWRKRHNEKSLEAWIGGGGTDALGSPFSSGSYKREYTKTGVRVGKGRYVNERRRKQ
ncbi:Nin one binding Zn-ribbon like-domain-containing protein [Lipomyces tetrasporus]